MYIDRAGGMDFKVEESRNTGKYGGRQEHFSNLGESLLIVSALKSFLLFLLFPFFSFC